MGWALDLLDNFATDTLAAGKYTIDSGSGSMAVTSGEISFSSTASEKLLYRNDRGSHINYRLTSKRRRPNTFLNTASHGICARRIDPNNFLLVQQSGGQLTILKKDGGSYTNLANLTGVDGDAGPNNYWIRGTFSGNLITIERFLTDPSLGGSPSHTLSYTLLGADATKYGAVSGLPGMRWSLSTANDTFGDDFRIELPGTLFLTAAPVTEVDTLQDPSITLQNYVRLYKDAPTSGGTDGGLISPSNPLTLGPLQVGTGGVVESSPVKLAARAVPGKSRAGAFPISIRGSSSIQFALAPDAAGSPGAWQPWGGTLTLPGPIGATNAVFWLKARVTTDENTAPGSWLHDDTVVLRIPTDAA